MTILLLFKNPVDADYILMERAPGICIATSWLKPEDRQAKRLAHSFMELEKKLLGISSGATGSPYFKNDIAGKLQAPPYTVHNKLLNRINSTSDPSQVKHSITVGDKEIVHAFQTSWPYRDGEEIN
jgi:hypothetical protein